MPGSIRLLSDEPRLGSHSQFEAWDKTDRQFRFPVRGLAGGSSMQALIHHLARNRWLEANDVHTQFFDAGIACCWFAQQGDQEPVSGETEDEAIARLARENGFELWVEA